MPVQRVLSRGLSAALLVLAAAVCAHWFWIFVAPPVSAPLEYSSTEVLRPLDSVRRANLFGASVTPSAAAPVRTDLVLRGISASRKGGMAVIATDRGRTVTVRAGDEIAPGITLERVERDHVIVVQNGVAQRLDLPQRKPVDAAPVAGQAIPAKK
jgi:type II secretory pathway component PulC